MMGYGLLWLSSLAGSFLVVATAASLASRCKMVRWQRFWPILASVIMFLLVSSAAVLGGILQQKNLQPKWLLWYGLSQTIAYIIGVVIILKKGFMVIASEEQAARPWPRVRLAVALGLVLFIYLVTLNFMDMRIVAEVANVRTDTAGRIISLLPAKLPDALNAYPVYEQAARALGPPYSLPGWILDSDKPDFDPNSEEVARLLAKHRHVLATVSRAASMPGYSVEMVVTNWLESPIPQYSYYHDFARLLSLTARLKALSGDPGGALRELTVMKNMAEHLRSFPLLISFIVAQSVDQTRVAGLEYVLAHTPDPPVGLIDTPVITQPSARISFLKAQRFEEQGILQTLAIISISSNVSSIFDLSGTDYKAQSAHLGERFLTKLWRVFFLPSELKAAKDIFAYRWGKPAATYEEMQKNLRAIVEAHESGELGILTAIALPDLSTYLGRAMWYDALRGLSDVALAATAYKGANSEYPTTLEELVPNYLSKIPLDPFDGEPLKFKLLNGGLDLHSVGPDQKLESAIYKGSIHFYLGQGPYEEYRVKPARAEARGIDDRVKPTIQ